MEEWGGGGGEERERGGEGERNIHTQEVHGPGQKRRDVF